MRFIDRATHGGCSKKGPATEVRDLLASIVQASHSADLGRISKNFPDAGLFVLGDQNLLSTVDIVLPMTLSPVDFGAVTACHVLSDIYASGGVPLFALCILGIPTGLSAASSESVSVVTSAVEQFGKEGAVLVGGHTMTDQEDFYLGFAVVGRPLNGVPFKQAQAAPGDAIVLTKALGTSIATTRWKLGEANEGDHADVLAGMKASNSVSARALTNFDVHACTDVTGYGLLGHLYNILFASEVGARVNLGNLPIYDSVVDVDHPDLTTQALHNITYVRDGLTGRSIINPFYESILFDSQVSGGLLVCVPPSEAENLVDALKQLGQAATIIGEIVDQRPGAIDVYRQPIS